MQTDVLAEEAWNFVVFKYGDAWVLTYVAGGVGLYEVSSRLNEDEVTRIRVTPEYAGSLAEQFRLAPENYQARQLRPSVAPPVRKCN